MQVRNSINELKDTKLWNYLNSIDTNYSAIAINFVNEIAPLLSSIIEIFPFYTRHDAHHGYRVLLRIEQIINKDCLDKKAGIKFSPDESLLLICASYAHDLGMTVFPGEEIKLMPELGIPLDSDWKQNPTLHNHLRENHSKRGGIYIADNCEKLQIPRNLLTLLHKLMEAHNLSINELDTELGKRYAAGEKEIDLKQLACILCIADAIEFSETRVVEGVLNLLKEK